ncbi:UNVERIFIED_CONTAM: hypothetical protein FKN15_028696 [Acipenser sinensis]
MELAHSLLLNEEALAQITEAKRPVFIFEWLRFLGKVLVAANKVDVKEKQKKLVEQLTGLISSAPGPPTRKLLAKNLATLYSIGDTFTVFQTLDKCNDIIKSKDDTSAYLPTKLIWENYKACLFELQNEAVFMWTTELENVATLCFKALEGSNYGVRVAVSKLLGTVMATALMPKQAAVMRQNVKRATLDEVLELMSTGFLRGGSGFLKSGGEMLKGGGSVSREVRVGVTQAYVVFVTTLGGQWLERNFATFLSHVLDLVSHPRAIQTHVEAVYSRRCVSFLLRATLGSLLGEKAQIAATKEICQAISKQMRAAYVVFVTTLGGQWLERNFATFLSHVLDLVSHPRATQTHVEAVYSRRCVSFLLRATLGSLLGEKAQIAAAKEICQAISKQMRAVGKEQILVVSIAEDLLRTAAQNSRLSLQRTQAGWLLLGALMTLGPSLVRYHLPKMLLLWRNVFPRSQKELEAEKARGDSFTWQVTLEGRAGALCAMRSFVAHCSELLTEDVIRRLMTPIECAMTMMSHIPSVIKAHGVHLKASAAMVRLRLYDILALLPPKTYEGSFNALLRELVTEFTLTDNSANTTTSLLRSLCHYDDSVLLGSWLQETDHKSIEDQLQPNSASGSGALEHDPSSIYLRVPVGEAIPGPLPLGVSVIDASVALFGVVFPHVSFKHRLQMLDHFAECIKQAKGVRQQAVQLNIFTAVLSALKINKQTNMCLLKTKFVSHLKLCYGVTSLVFVPRVSSVYCSKTASIIWRSLLLKSARDVVSRTGHSLALGCLHRYVGGIGSGQHLKTSVSILLALAQDGTSHEVQVHLCSSHLLLRRAAVACLRQLAQREAAEVCEYAMSLAKKAGDPKDSTGMNLNITETGLEGVLFGMLDRETDKKLCSDIHDTLGHMLSSLAVEKLSHWLKLCKDVLAASIEAGAAVPLQIGKEEDLEKKDEMDDDIMFTALGEDDKSMPSVAPRWVTRVFAADCLCRIILLCESADKVHFDLAAARSAKLKNPKDDLLVLHLPDLIRMAFMAATDHSNQLRMAGLQALEDIIKKFAAVPEPEFPGHVILEQYQANVCSTWIGSRVVSDLNDLRRVHNLLVSSLDKVQAGKGSSSQLYSESATTMEKLAVLKAWAEVYIVAMKIKKEADNKPQREVKSNEEEEDDFGAADVLPPDSLITLVQPELPTLNHLWLAALKDYALLTLPAEFASQLPSDGGAFYTPETIDTARLHYRNSWAPILHAVAVWLNSTGFALNDPSEDMATSLQRGPTAAVHSQPSSSMSPASKTQEDVVKDKIHLLLGVSIEFLCFPRPEEPIEHVAACLQALRTLLDSPCVRTHIAEDQLLGVELLNVLHRLLLTRDPPSVQLQVTGVVWETIRAAQDELQEQRHAKCKEDASEKDAACMLGEGGDTGGLVPGKSLVFAAMELLVFILVRHLPQLNTKVMDSPSHMPYKPQRLPEESARLVAATVTILADLPSLCSPDGSMTILPTILFLITGVLKETAEKTADNQVPPPVSAALQGIKTIITSPLAKVDKTHKEWTALIRSTLASVLEYSQPDESKPNMDEVSMLTAITLFLLSAGAEIVGVTSLQNGCMNRFRNALNSSDPWDAACPYKQCRLTEVILKKAYAASAFTARLGSYNSILMAYQAHLLRSIAEAHKPSSQQLDELCLMSRNLLWLSKLSGQVLGRNLAAQGVAGSCLSDRVEENASVREEAVGLRMELNNAVEPTSGFCGKGPGQQPEGGGGEAARAQYSIPGILHFLQHEWARFEVERAQWDVERAELQGGLL